jgi:putative endopeptidase
MKSLFAIVVCSIGVNAQTAEQPLQSLPYTPVLDLSAMEPSAKPCEDFYRFSCGGWIKRNPIPADQSHWDVYGKLTAENERYLWGLLLDAAKPEARRAPPQQKIGDYFGACMDESAIEKSGARPLKPVLDEIDAVRSLKDLAALVGRIHLEFRDGSSPLFGFGSNQDFEDANRMIAFASASGLGLPDRDYYLKQDGKSVDTRAKYLLHVRQMLEMIGDKPSAARAAARRILSMETALAKASLSKTDKRDPYKIFHKMTASQLAALTPSLDWNAYLRVQGLSEVKELNVTEPAFFKQLEREFKTRKLADWKVYLRWHVTRAKAPLLTTRFEKANYDFYSAYLRGTKEQKPRWKRCVQLVDRDLGEALGQVFVEKTFSPATKARALKMTREIEQAMEAEIGTLSWMSEATKQRALEKLHGMVNKIGYPDRWRDYSKLAINAGDFFGNATRATIFEAKRQLDKIGKPVDRGEWQMTPPTVNAYYDPQMNDINFPAGVLQPPLFDPKLDDAPNYGDTGATIGHELTHGFDDEGRQFDAKGNLKDWWTKTDSDEFQKRAACVIDQYSKYTVVDDIKINGKLTAGEDIADLGGTLLAYLAWKSEMRGQTLTPIDGFTPDQRYFIGMAQWACGSERPELLRLNAITNPHSPLKYRVNGVVSNLPQFSEAFACKAGQPMAPVKICKVW